MSLNEQFSNNGMSLSSQSRGEWEEEGLFWRGPNPPLPSDSKTGDTWTDKDWIEIPHEHYIPISKFRINEVLWQFPKVRESRKEFKHFLTRIESIYHFHYYALLEQLKNDYEFFDPEKGKQRRSRVNEEEIRYREQRFLSNFLLMMVRGNFLPFSDEDARHSKEYNYLFDLKVRIKWDSHDPIMLEEFTKYAKTDEARSLLEQLETDDLEEYLQAPEDYKNNVLIFWRGIDRDMRTETKPLQKLDVWLSNIFAKIVSPLQRFVELFRGERKANAELLTGMIKDVGSLLTFGLLDQIGSKNDRLEEEERTVVFERRWIRRLNMQNQTLSIKDIFKPKQLQEPEFEKMLCLFRMKPKKKIVDIVKEKLKVGEAQEEEKDLSIYLKMFKKIPLADADLILPFKSPTMKSFDLTMLLLTGLGSIFALIKGFQSGGKIAIILMGVLMTMFIKLITGYMRTLRKYNARMISELYDKNLDNDTGVLQYLIDSIEEQEYKESVLAYYMLWLQGRPMTEKELDGAIEEFIKQYFDDLEVDFEVDDALHKIVIHPGERDKHHLPLVEELHSNGIVYYRALPLPEALEIMDAKWEYLNEQRLQDLTGL